MALIILLILLGIFLFGVEIFLLPGITVAGIGAFISCGISVYYSFVNYGNTAGFITLGVILVLSVATVVIGLRDKTWRKLTLKTNIDSQSHTDPAADQIRIGDRGTAITRLAPAGKVMINGRNYEAKSTDTYIDQHSEIEVTGFDNFSVVVKRVAQPSSSVENY